ncbi:MAG: hypothetical protein M0Q53_00115 [Prolixibacteraceae bacterium]|jgi:hypothetical protein|nr:hypothetical protein [Prolixibacteraceae bacterium]
MKDFMVKHNITSLFFLFITFSSLAQTQVFQIGTSSKIINNEVGRYIQGAGIPRQATEILDNLEANAIYFSKGKYQLLMVSCDLVGIELSFAARLREKMGVAAAISPRDILISCTHTHGGPSLLKTNYLMPVDEEYMGRLEKWLVELAQEAVATAQPGKIGWAKGEAHIGFNRRLTWSDGTHTMHGDAKRKDFTGLEGPDDPQHLAMFATDLNGNLLSVLYHNTTHPTIYYGAGVYTADFPGEVRTAIRAKVGHQIPVLFLNGAQGDISIEDMLNPISESREQKIKRVSDMVVDMTMALYKNITYDRDPVLKHEYYDLKVSVRLPNTDQVLQGRKVLERIDKGEIVEPMEMIMAFGAVHLNELYSNNLFEVLPVHALRIGELAVVTQPCELYCQFGLDIKRRSPVSNTIVVGLTDGYGGYCPTQYGVMGGGYSGAPISWCRLEANSGYKIVETASRLLYSLWSTE